MATPAQIGIGAGAIAAVSLGGYAIYTVTTSEGEEIKPITFTLSDVEKFSDQDYKGKLLSLIKKENLEYWIKPHEEKNEKWWDGIFKNKYSSKPTTITLDPIFSKLESGYSKQVNAKSLNHACDSAYKQEKSKYTFTSSNLLKNIAYFCTNVLDDFDVLEPNSTTYINDTISDANYSNGVLKNQDNKSKLVKSTGVPDNKYWWIWAYEKLNKQTLKTKSDYFKHVTSGYADQPASGSGTVRQTALNQACDAAYKKNKTELQATASLLNEILEFCSSVKPKTSLTLPGESVSNGEPTTRTTHNKSSLTGSTYTNKFLSLTKEDNLAFLVKSNDKANNESWWNWSYLKKFGIKKNDQQLDTIFSSINKGWGETGDNNALNNACEKAYTADKNKYSFEDSSFLLKNISDFCTTTFETKDVSEPKAEVYGSSPSASGEYDWGILKVSKNGTSLVKPVDTNNNDLWWNWAFKNLFKDATTKKDPFVSTIQKGWSSNTGDQTLSKACDTAYKKPEVVLSKETDELLKNIQKFCTVGKSEVTLTKPSTPTTIKTVNENQSKGTDYQNGIALESGNPEKLVDTKNTANQEWWNWAFRNRYKFRESTFKLYEGLFKEADIEKGYGTEENDKALNQKCKKAYKKTKVETKNATEILDNINEFCTKDKSVKITQPSS